MLLRRAVPVLFILLISIPIFPHVLSIIPATPSRQFSSALSSGVLMALQRATGSSNQLILAASGDDVQVSAGTAPQNEPSIAVNPSNPQHLVAGANDQLVTGTWLAVYTSSNAGLTWTNGLIPNIGPPLASFQEGSDPAVSFSQNGTLYYAGLVFNIDRKSNTAVDGTVFVSKSTDDGSSFPLTTIVATGSKQVGGTFNDKPYLGVDQTTGQFAGRVYVSWTNFTGSSSDIMVAYSSDWGRSFSSSHMVSNSLGNQGSVPVVGPNGELYIVWNDLSDNQILEVKSTDGGVSFSKPIVVSSLVQLPQDHSFLANSFFRVNSNPTAAVDDTNGNVYVAWADYRNGYADVLSSRSLDGGSTWSNPIRVTDDSTRHDHFFPWMAVSHGLLGIVFYDRRLDPQNHLVDVFYAESADGGASFSSNVRVTDVSFNPDAIIFSNGESFIGDYIGIASNGTVAHPVWTDLRNPGREDIFTEARGVEKPPVVAPVGNQTIYPGAELRFSVKATDPNVGKTLTMVGLGMPSGATFASTSSTNGTVGGSFDWAPSIAQAPGNYSVEFKASDGFLSASANVTITVKINLPPSLVVPGYQTVLVGSRSTFLVKATDPDVPPDSVTISCDNCSHLGATFDPSTGNFTWAPGSGQGTGNYSASFTATDHLLPQLTDSKTVSIRVVVVELPPVLTVPGAQTVEAGNLLIFSVSATDPDGHNLISLSASGLPSGASFDPELGSLVWTPGSRQGPGVYTVTFRGVEVGTNGLSDTKTVTITVEKAASSPGHPSIGGLGSEILLVAGAAAVFMAYLSSYAIRARRGRNSAEEGPKPESTGMG